MQPFYQCTSNPTGRTGFAGRGLLDYWGPNHCADPVVTRCGMFLSLTRDECTTAGRMARSATARR